MRSGYFRRSGYLAQFLALFVLGGVLTNPESLADHIDYASEFSRHHIRVPEFTVNLLPRYLAPAQYRLVLELAENGQIARVAVDRINGNTVVNSTSVSLADFNSQGITLNFDQIDFNQVPPILLRGSQFSSMGGVVYFSGAYGEAMASPIHSLNDTEKTSRWGTLLFADSDPILGWKSKFGQEFEEARILSVSGRWVTILGEKTVSQVDFTIENAGDARVAITKHDLVMPSGEIDMLEIRTEILTRLYHILYGANGICRIAGKKDLAFSVLFNPSTEQFLPVAQPTDHRNGVEQLDGAEEKLIDIDCQGELQLALAEFAKQAPPELIEDAKNGESDPKLRSEVNECQRTWMESAQACFNPENIAIQRYGWMMGKSNCASEFVWGGVINIGGLVESLYGGATWVASSAVGAANTQAGEWFEKNRQAPVEWIKGFWFEEGENTKAPHGAGLDRETFTKFASMMKKDPRGTLNLLVTEFMKGMYTEIQTNFGCEQWEPGSIPHLPGSKCKVPWKGSPCFDCNHSLNLVCGVMGEVIAEIPASALFGGLLRAVTTGTNFVVNVGVKRAAQIGRLLASVSNKISRHSRLIRRVTLAIQSMRLPERVILKNIVERAWNEILGKGLLRQTVSKANKMIMESEQATRITTPIRDAFMSWRFSGSAQPNFLTLAARQVAGGVMTGAALVTHPIVLYFRTLEEAFAWGAGGIPLVLEVRAARMRRATDAAEAVLLKLNKYKSEGAEILRDCKGRRSARVKGKFSEELTVEELDKEISIIEGNLAKLDKDILAQKAVVNSAAIRWMQARAKRDVPALMALLSKGEGGAEEVAKNLIMVGTALKIQKAHKAQRAQKMADTSAELALPLAENLHLTWRQGRILDEAMKLKSIAMMEEYLAKYSGRMPSRLEEFLRSHIARLRNGELTHAPRIKLSGHLVGIDQAAFIDGGRFRAYPHSGGYVDIAQLSVADLPKTWKDDNVNAARNLLEMIDRQIISSGGPHGFETPLVERTLASMELANPLESLTQDLIKNPVLVDPLEAMVAVAGYEHSKWLTRTAPLTEMVAVLELRHLNDNRFWDNLEKNLGIKDGEPKRTH